MKRFIIMAALMAMVAVGAFAEDNLLDKNVMTFWIGTTATSTAANSAIFRVPQDAKIDSVYITDLSGVIASTTDIVQTTMFLNNAANGYHTSSASAIVAVTPKAITPTVSDLHAGDIIQFKVTKTGGLATTNMGVSVGYHNTNH